jgi:hypothetical protein
MDAATLDAYRCLASKGAVRLRVTRLTSGGAPDNGAGNGYVTDQLITIANTPQVTTGDSFVQKTGSGAVCVDLKDPDSVNRTTLTMSLCALDSELLELLTGGTLITVGGITVGYQEAEAGSVIPAVCLEAWSLAVDGAQQAADGPDALYYHFVFPYTTWVPGAQELSNGVLTVPLTGDGRPNASIGYGPDGHWPVPMTSYRQWYLTAAIPDADCGYVSVAGSGASLA